MYIELSFLVSRYLIPLPYYTLLCILLSREKANISVFCELLLFLIYFFQHISQKF